MHELSILDPRIPAWDKTALTERSCPICGAGSSPALYKRPDGLRVYRCASCSTHVVSPAPSEADLASFYASYDSSHSRNELSLDELRALLDSMSPFEDVRIRELSSLLPLRGSKVLDVGFGRAGLLYQLKRLGADVYGVDPDVSAHTHARALGVEQTVHGDLSQMDALMRFDAVMLNDVVEHPLSPLPMLRECAGLLASGGVLLLWTPNGGAIEATEDPVMLRVDLEHMQYLSTQSCTRIAEVLGLRVVHLETVGFVDLSEYARARAGKLEGASRQESFRRVGKRWLRAVPGFSRANAVRRAFGRALAGDGAGVRGMDDRRGTYHLFAMFRKP